MISLKEKLESLKIVAVVGVNDADDAVKLAETLLESGIGGVEMTLRSDNALKCIEAVATRVPQMCVGAGTVLTPRQIWDVKNAGVQFAVAPGCSRRVLAAARDAALPFAPGIMTPSDIETALEFDCRVLKFFPAESSSGGIRHLESMAAPYKHLGIKFLPLGGLNADNMRNYLASPLVCAIGGSWIASAKLIAAKDWDAVRKNAQAAVAKLA